MSDIAKILNQEKIEPLTKNNYKLSVNAWSSGKINHLLKNRRLLGEFRIEKTGEVFENYYPKIILHEDFDAVQAMRKNKKKLKFAGRKSINIFQSKIFCANCAQKFYFEKDDKTLKTSTKTYYMLKCSGRSTKGCKSPSIRYEDFINSTIEETGIFIKDKKDNMKDINIIKTKISKVLKNIQELKAKIDKLEEMNDNNELDFEVYLKESSKVQKEIRINEALIADHRLDISMLSNENKLDHFDINDQMAIDKAKRFINDKFSAFIVSKCSKYCLALFRNGTTALFFIQSKKIKRKNDYVEQKSIMSAQMEIETFLEEIKELYKQDLVDNSFSDILKSISFWQFEKPEKLSLSILNKS